MNFGEKLFKCRKEMHLTQQELADKAGLSRKSIYSFENGITVPKSKSTYTLLANALEVDASYLRGDTDAFLDSAELKYGVEGRNQAEKLVTEMGALFAGGTMSDKDWDGVMRAIQEHYWVAKEKNKENAEI